MHREDSLIPKHGGYRNLKSFKIARLIFDVTVHFCNRYIDRRSRTHDQMVQAARSGVQNIAEGSEVSATSRKMELKLTQVARASLEELRLDYEDFLRQNALPLLEPDHPALMRFKGKRCETLDEVRDWVAAEYEKGRGGHGRTRTDTDDGEGRTDTDDGEGRTDTDDGEERTDTDDGERRTTRTYTDVHGRILMRGCPCPSVSVRVGPCRPCSPAPQKPIPPRALAANGALSLLNLAHYLLDRQIARLAEDFQEKGGFTERLYRTRKRSRSQEET